MAEYLPFTPFPGLSWKHFQTMLAAFPAFARCPPSQTRIFPLEDGDKIACEFSTPEDWTSEDPTVVTIHGLCGSHRSAYQVRLSRKLFHLGVRVVRVNLRGCGTGHGLAKHPYHAGQSEDIFEVVKLLKQETPASDIHLVGYSMGGNIAVKLAGELGIDGPRYLTQVIAICAPLSLANCSRMISMPSNWIYERKFVSWRLQEIHQVHKAFPELPDYKIPWLCSIKEFDDRYTAPRSGFHNVEDYFKRASAESVAQNIAVPCKILFSEDDPIIDPSILDHHELQPCVEIHKTERGGHVGFVGHPRRSGGVRWLDSMVLRWIAGYYFHKKGKSEQPLGRASKIVELPRFVTAIFEDDLAQRP